jgi:hypothetical protein
VDSIRAHFCSPFGLYGIEVCNCGHFGIVKTCNFSAKCPNDDDNGIYYTRTEGGFWKVLLAFSAIWRVFGANTYGVIFGEGI